MKGIVRRMTGLLLALAMLLPLAAGAETSGFWGVHWRLDDNRVLTLYGQGHMYNGSFGFNESPWGTNVWKVVIEEGVTGIGGYAFYKCQNLRSASIPDTVTYISENAFEGCSMMKTLIVPDSVNRIGECAFRSMSSLRCISIPSTLESFGKNVFSATKGIRYVWITGDQKPAYTLPNGLYQATVICHEFSEVDFWAMDHGYKTAYLEQVDPWGPLELNVITEELTMKVGRTQYPEYEIISFGDGHTITWSSSAPEIAHMSEHGWVVANAPGTAVITATCGGLTDSFTVTVENELSSFDVSAQELWLISKAEAPIYIENLSPAGVDYRFEVSCPDDGVVYVAKAEEGVVVTGRMPGDTVLTVRDEVSGLKKTVKVHVFYPVTEIAFAESQVQLAAGGTAQLTAQVTCRTQTTQNHLVTFASSDEDVAAVDAYGVVTAVAEGSAVITATSESGVSASCTVLVGP